MNKHLVLDQKNRDQGLPARPTADKPAVPMAGLPAFGGARGDQGFTLIEVLVAIVILVFGLLAVGSMQIAAIRGNFMGGNTSIALSLASEKMEDILNSEFNDPPGVQKLTDRISSNNGNLSTIAAGTTDWEEDITEEGVVVAGAFYRRIWNIADPPTAATNTKNVMVIVTWDLNKHRVAIASIKRP